MDASIAIGRMDTLGAFLGSRMNGNANHIGRRYSRLAIFMAIPRIARIKIMAMKGSPLND